MPSIAVNNAFQVRTSKSGFSMKLWRGERMCLIGFDVQVPEPDLVGFAIECRAPGEKRFTPLPNRIAFDYPVQVDTAVTGKRLYPSTEAPFQKFRWIHFPATPQAGMYEYRGTKIHMPSDGKLVKGTSLQLAMSLDPVTYHGFLDVGFTRGFASSQAFRDKFPDDADMDAIGRQIIPSTADAGLDFKKMPGDIYEWLGFEATDLIFGLLDQIVADPHLSLDMFAYDLNEPDIAARLEALGARLRIVIDNSTSKNKAGKVTGHGTPDSAESEAAKRLAVSAGSANVTRTHFKSLQHNKVLIARRDGVAFKVLTGSTNFSFRGIYIQSNNVLVFEQADVAQLYQDTFNQALSDPLKFAATDLASKWHAIANCPIPIRMCVSPHSSSDLSLNPVRGVIEQASTSVLYSVAFLNLIKSGPTKEAFDRLISRPVFSYGVTDKEGGLAIKKPDGSIGLVDFAFLAKNAPEPFRSEWSGGQGINIHHKFVVADFNLPSAKLITGSSNLAPSGEKGNGDNLLIIEDQKIAVAYAIEAIRIFDHLHFRHRLQEASTGPADQKLTKLSLAKPRQISGQPAWFERYYAANSQLLRDRQIFSS